jgi:hypothetical protein
MVRLEHTDPTKFLFPSLYALAAYTFLISRPLWQFGEFLLYKNLKKILILLWNFCEIP